MLDLNENTVVVRNKGVVSSELDGEIVIMSIENGEYYGLNHTATEIWNIIDSPIRISILCEKLCEKFEIERQDCLNEIYPLIYEMGKKNLLIFKL